MGYAVGLKPPTLLFMDDASQSPTFQPLTWPVDAPHLLRRTVSDADIDLMGHVNNVVYLRWLEEAAWDHTHALGLDWATYQRLGAGFVARRHELDYLKPALSGDVIVIATWIADNPGRVTMDRRYQLVRERDGVVVMRAHTLWACVDLTTGAPRRMPPEFAQGFVVADPVTPR